MSSTRRFIEGFIPVLSFIDSFISGSKLSRIFVWTNWFGTPILKDSSSKEIRREFLNHKLYCRVPIFVSISDRVLFFCCRTAHVRGEKDRSEQISNKKLLNVFKEKLQINIRLLKLFGVLLSRDISKINITVKLKRQCFLLFFLAYNLKMHKTFDSNKIELQDLRKIFYKIIYKNIFSEIPFTL